MQAGTYFSEGEKNVALFFSFNFRILLASFHAASRAPCSCHSRPQILERWRDAHEVHLGKYIRAKDFGLECLRDVQQLLWILHVALAPICLSSSVKSMKTSAPYPGIRNPIVVRSMIDVQQVLVSTHDK